MGFSGRPSIPYEFWKYVSFMNVPQKTWVCSSATACIIAYLLNNSWWVHLNAFPRQVEITVVFQESDEALAKVFRFVGMLDIVDNQAYDAEASQSTCVHFIQATHHEKLLDKRHHVYKVGILLLPALECRLSLDSTQVFKGNVNLKSGKPVLELDDRDLGLDDLASIGIHACALEPSSCFIQQAFISTPLRHVDNRLASVVILIGNVHQIHISSRQV